MNNRAMFYVSAMVVGMLIAQAVTIRQMNKILTEVKVKQINDHEVVERFKHLTEEAYTK